jgi:hypothetical protein
MSNAALWERALRVTPGGVSSPVRAFKAVGGAPYFVTRGEGPYVWDADGRRYVDYVQSYGASILGHAHPKVVEAVKAAAALGTTFGAPTHGEVDLAEEICSRVAGCEEVRFVSSGTEAAMSAVRLARGFTGRERVIVFFPAATTATATGSWREAGAGWRLWACQLRLGSQRGRWLRRWLCRTTSCPQLVATSPQSWSSPLRRTWALSLRCRVSLKGCARRAARPGRF